jgi:hypothetical protein
VNLQILKETEMKKLLFILILAAGMGGAMAQMQDKIKPVGAWSSFTGCTKACSDYLGFEYPLSWISGVTGYAFILNMHPEVCPSGPTAFDHGFLKQNAEALGLRFRTTDFTKWEGDLEARQREAFENVKKELAAGHPAFGWELGLPEYYLIAGTNEKGYEYFDFDGSVKTCPWDSVATSEIGMAEFCFLDKAAPQDELRQLKSALEFLGDYTADPARYAIEGYTMGPAAYDLWIKALKEGKTDPWGMGYNTQVWAEARWNARAFLAQAKKRLGEERGLDALDLAIARYEEVAEALNQVSEIYGFPPREEDHSTENAAKAAELLARARDAEKAGIKALLELKEKL